MSVLRYRCPTTSDEITTVIETGPETLFRMKVMNLKIWVWCPHCAAGHQIQAGDATLPEAAFRPEPNVRPEMGVRPEPFVRPPISVRPEIALRPQPTVRRVEPAKPIPAVARISLR